MHKHIPVTKKNMGDVVEDEMPFIDNMNEARYRCGVFKRVEISSMTTSYLVRSFA